MQGSAQGENQRQHNQRGHSFGLTLAAARPEANEGQGDRYDSQVYQILLDVLGVALDQRPAPPGVHRIRIHEIYGAGRPLIDIGERVSIARLSLAVGPEQG